MSLAWSAQQVEWLREMGFDVLARRGVAQAPGPGPLADAALGSAAAAPDGDAAPALRASARVPAEVRPGGIPAALARVARGVDLTPLLAGGPPHDPASRRAFWRALRPLRKAARAR